MPAERATYALPDEPTPSRWQRLAVNPMWVLLCLMLASSTVAYGWAVVNAVALGSPWRWRIAAGAAAAAVGSVALAFGLLLLQATELVDLQWIPYLRLVVTVWRLGWGYVLHEWTGPTWQLHQHFGRPHRSAAWVVFALCALSFYAVTVIPTGLWWMLR